MASVQEDALMDEPENSYGDDLDFTPVDPLRPSFLHSAMTWLVLLAALGVLGYALFQAHSSVR
jgi:hypothetical protein